MFGEIFIDERQDQAAVIRNFVVLTDVFGRREYMSITRRSFGGLMGASFGMLARRGFALSKDSNANFTRGVDNGEPLKDRVIIWTIVIPGDGFDRGLDLECQLAADKEFAKVTSSGHFFTDASRDFTVKVDASQRGWPEVTVVPDSVSARWHYVDTILDLNFKVHRTEALVCWLGQRRFSLKRV